MFENPRRGRQARSFTTNVLKLLDLKASSEQIFFRKLSLGALGEMLVSDMDIHKFNGKILTETYIQTWPPPQYPGRRLPYERAGMLIRNFELSP